MAAGSQETALLLRLLCCASKPFMHQLHAWLYSGLIDDPADDFFIAEGEPTPSSHHGAQSFALAKGRLHVSATPCCLLAAMSSGNHLCVSEALRGCLRGSAGIMMQLAQPQQQLTDVCSTSTVWPPVMQTNPSQWSPRSSGTLPTECASSAMALLHAPASWAPWSQAFYLLERAWS